MSAKDLSDFLRKRMLELGLTNKEVALRAKVSRQTWYNLLNAQIEEAKFSTLIRIANTLETHPLVMMRIYFSEKSLQAANTLASGSRKYGSGFVSDVTYPDNSIVNVGQVFLKTWEVVNLGTTSWSNLYLQCVDELIEVRAKNADQHALRLGKQYGLLPLQQRIPIPETLPEEHVQLSVEFRAPDYPCSAISHWKTIDANGNLVFPGATGLYCLVRVVDI